MQTAGENFQPTERSQINSNSDQGGLTRRDFVRSAITAGLLAGVAPVAVSWGAETKSGDMLYRELGSTGQRVSAIGVGGFHMGSPEEAEGIRIVRTAVDHGVTFMDNCWDYHDGG